MVKIRKRYVFLVFLVVLTLNFAFLSSISKSEIKSKSLYFSAEPTSIEIQSEPGKLEDGAYLVGSELTFQINKESGQTSVSLEITGQGRFFNLSFDEGVNYWTYQWNTEEPRPNDDPIKPGEYELTLKINGEEHESNPSKLVFSTGEEKIPLGLVIGIIIAIVGIIGFSGLFVLKRRKATDEEPEVSKIKKRKKKRGKIYSGASSIGKRSGQLAESKTNNKKISSKKRQTGEESRVAKPSVFKEVESPFGVKKADSKPMRRVAANFNFEANQSKSTAMMKDMELKMNLDEKTKFLISKAESILSNIEFFKTILTKKNQFQYFCPECNKAVSINWTACPHCLLEKSDLELGLEQSLISLSDDIRFCTDCNRIIKPEWNKCPYCYIKKNL